MTDTEVSAKKIVTRLSALAQDTRLRVFRLLIEAGPEGIPATAIAEALDVRRNLMSTHLNILASAGLTTTRRDGRRIYHAVDMEAARDLISFLVKDCCNGHPEICQELTGVDMPIRECCEDATL